MTSTSYVETTTSTSTTTVYQSTTSQVPTSTTTEPIPTSTTATTATTEPYTSTTTVETTTTTSHTTKDQCDEDQCANGNVSCKENSDCVDLCHGFECKCQEGYELSETGECEEKFRVQKARSKFF